jgi:hypothetical protein
MKANYCKWKSNNIIFVIEDIPNKFWQIKSTGIEEILPIAKRKGDGLALGRPKKDAVRDRRTAYQDICDRVEVE